MDTTAVSRPYPAPVPDDLAPADRFVELACLTFHPNDSARRRSGAERIMKTSPDLAAQSLSAAVVLGDAAAVHRHLVANPRAATTPSGPRGWVPLLYLCFGRVLGPVGDAVATARLLLDAGADPNSHVLFHAQYRWSAIAGAIGEGESGKIAAPPHAQARALVELLLDAGADANDGQALYNTHFERSNAWLELFLARGLGPAHRVNWTPDDPTPMLDFMLGQAARQGYVDRAALLLAHGASPNGRDGYQKRPHLETALIAGHAELAYLLIRHGAAAPVLSPAEALRVAWLKGDEAAVRTALSPPIDGRDDVGTLLAAAKSGRSRAVRLLLDSGVPVNAENNEGVTALHMAAEGGHRLVVDHLLARGASLTARDRVHNGTPLGRATWCSRCWPTPERTEVVRALAQQSTDVIGVVYAGAVDRLAALLAQDPTRANEKRASGWTALHELAEGEIPEWRPLLALLLQHGADLHARTTKGQTPLDIATGAQADDIVEAFRHLAARP